jgi:hypothetical protein
MRHNGTAGELDADSARACTSVDTWRSTPNRAAPGHPNAHTAHRRLQQNLIRRARWRGSCPSALPGSGSPRQPACAGPTYNYSVSLRYPCKLDPGLLGIAAAVESGRHLADGIEGFGLRQAVDSNNHRLGWAARPAGDALQVVEIPESGDPPPAAFVAADQRAR